MLAIVVAIIVSNDPSAMQVVVGIAARPPKTKMLRRAWNLGHWTVGRAVLALAIANFFIGADLSEERLIKAAQQSGIHNAHPANTHTSDAKCMLLT